MSWFDIQRTRQPQQAVPLSPWARTLDLRTFISASINADVITGAQPSGTLPSTRAPASAGVVYRRVGTEAVADCIANLGTPLNGATELTIHALVTPASVQDGTFFAKWGAEYTCLIGFDATGKLRALVSNTAATRRGVQTTGAVYSAGQTLHVAYVWSAAGRAELYVNGINQTVSDFASFGTLTSVLDVATSAANGYLIGRQADANPYSGSVGFVAMHRKALANADVLQIARNPWQLFAHQTRRIWVPGAGGGAPSIQPSGIASAEAFGLTVFTRSSTATVAPTGVASAEALGTAQFIRASQIVLQPPSIASGEAFGTAVFTRRTSATLQPASITSGEAFGTAVFTRDTLVVTVQPSGLSSAEAFGAASVLRTQVSLVFPSGIPSAEAFGNATLLRDGVPPVGGVPHIRLSIRLGISI